jgi:hypothetical protein
MYAVCDVDDWDESAVRKLFKLYGGCKGQPGPCGCLVEEKGAALSRQFGPIF